MSIEPGRVTREHFSYIAARTRRPDAFLLRLDEEARLAGLPAIRISDEEASLMAILLKLVRARRVIEVGTLAGFSAICMARALPRGGLVTTIENDPAHAAFAREHIAASDVAGKVEVIEGDAEEVLRGFEESTFDAAFVDADKQRQVRFVEGCLRLLRPGGLLMVDNALAFGEILEAEPTDPDVPAVREFNDWLARDPRLEAVIVPVGDGLWVGLRTENG